jgi:methylmalonyl-CoA epimerase
MKLEHVGIAVGDAEAALRVYERLFGAAPYKSEMVASEGVRTLFLDAGGAKVELLEATSPESPIARHVERRGEGLHHLAFEVRDLERALRQARERGFRALNETPKRGADGKRIAFLHPKDTAGVLVELCETAPEPLTPAFAPLAGGQVAYYEGGRREAPPLVLLHAAMGSSEMELRLLLTALEPHFRTVAIDFPAHGRSDDFEGEDPITVDLLVESVLAVLDALALERAHVFGFSMGAAAALGLARRHPERVDRLVLHAANVQWDPAEAEAMTAGMDPEALPDHSPRWAERLREHHGEGRWHRLAHRMIAFTRALPDQRFPDDALRALAVPTLVSHGDADRYFRLDHALHLWRTIPGARLAVHPGLDHPIQGADPVAFARMLRGFLLGG